MLLHSSVCVHDCLHSSGVGTLPLELPKQVAGVSHCHFELTSSMVESTVIVKKFLVSSLYTDIQIYGHDVQKCFNKVPRACVLRFNLPILTRFFRTLYNMNTHQQRLQAAVGTHYAPSCSTLSLCKARCRGCTIYCCICCCGK